MKKFKIIIFCLVLFSLCLSGCVNDEVPSLDNEGDWTMVIEDERAEPQSFEYRFWQVNSNQILPQLFTYQYEQGESFIPNVYMRYKDDKVYYVVKIYTITTGIPIVQVEGNIITSPGEYNLSFRVYENEEAEYPIQRLPRIKITIE